MSYRKKMIEVALPLKAINEASAREKSIRHGHPSTLHLWWARRPLASCRAVLFASLVDDPDSDPAYRRPDGSVDEERAGIKRAGLFNLIEELVQWENTNNQRTINAARAEIARCVASRKIELGEFARDTIIYGSNRGQKHPKGTTAGDGTTAWEIVLMKARPDVVNAFLTEYAQPVLDPFCGGGSIPLEAQRLGLRAYASDLNPVPVLITKALIEIPPKFAGRPPVNPEWQAKNEGQKAATIWQGTQGLAEDILYYGQWMRDQAEKRIGHLYPKAKITKEIVKDRPDLEEYVGQELTVIAWLWTRTVECPNPSCRVRMPLMKSYWLSTKTGNKAWISAVRNGESREMRLSVNVGDGNPPSGTVSRKGARCISCATPVSFGYIRDEGKAGRLGQQLIGMVAEGRRKRIYLSAEESHALCASRATPKWTPDEAMADNPFSLRPPLYGLLTFGDLFSKRQLVLLDTLAELVHENLRRVESDAQTARLPIDVASKESEGQAKRVAS